jgi:hypothetical protein
MMNMKHISIILGLLITISCSSCHELEQILEQGNGTGQSSNTGPTDLASYRDTGHELSAFGIAYSDIPYSSDSKNDYDLILPKSYTVGDKVPVVVFFHGGGFVQGNKNSLYKKTPIKKEMEIYLNGGIAVANANYRLLGNNESQGVIKCLEDAKYLVQRLKYEAPGNGIDPDAIILRGTSAGGSLSMWVALSDDMAEPQSNDPVLRMSSRVAGAVTENVQSSLDVKRWEEVFQEFNFKYDQGLDAEMKARLFGLYGLSAPNGPIDRGAFESETALYRSKVDFSSFMDQDDPPILAANKPKFAGPPTEKNLIFHHKNHARFLETESKKVGGTFNASNAFYYNTDPSVKDLTDFVKNILK